MKKILLFLGLCLLGTSAFAGGSIFGGHKTRPNNPDGVSSINVHICGSLSCPEVIIKKGDCGKIPHTHMQYGVCMCDEGYQVKDGECVDICEASPIEHCTTCVRDGKEVTCKACEESYVLEEGACSAKCLMTGTCEGDTCKNGGGYPHCWYRCRCSTYGENENACACAESLDQIVCGYEDCIVQKEGEVGRCSTYGYNENACACAPSLDQIVCNDEACIAPSKEGEVCRCSSGSNENACACAPTLDQIVCGDSACTVIPVD